MLYYLESFFFVFLPENNTVLKKKKLLLSINILGIKVKHTIICEDLRCFLF